MQESPITSQNGRRHQTFICSGVGQGVSSPEKNPQSNGSPLPVLSDDKFVTQLEQAAAFMQTVRQSQRESAKKLMGRNRISEEQKSAISDSARESRFVAAVKQVTNIDLPLNDLFERFEEMCRRNRFTADVELRPAIIRLLAAELLVNSEVLGTSAEKLVPATVHNGAVAPALLKAFPEFSDKPYVFEKSMVCAPAWPDKYLDVARRTIAELSSDPEFAEFSATPSAYTHAAFNARTHPREFLRNAARHKDGGWRAASQIGT